MEKPREDHDGLDDDHWNIYTTQRSKRVHDRPMHFTTLGGSAVVAHFMNGNTRSSHDTTIIKTTTTTTVSTPAATTTHIV